MVTIGGWLTLLPNVETECGWEFGEAEGDVHEAVDDAGAVPATDQLQDLKALGYDVHLELVPLEGLEQELGVVPE